MPMNKFDSSESLKWVASFDSNVGTIREVNEDSVFVNSDVGIWAVADGLGGYESGDVASNMIVSSLSNININKSLPVFIAEIEKNIIDVNKSIYDYSKHYCDGRTIGSTVVSLSIHGKTGICLWVGDSRLYRFRNDELTQISRDHSYVQELVDNGIISKDDVVNHPNSNRITKAIGAKININPDILTFDIKEGDIFLLCSDGLYNSVDENEIKSSIKNYNVDFAVEKLIKKSLDNLAKDNVSLVLVKNVSV